MLINPVNASEQAVRSTAQRAGIVDRINVLVSIISVKFPEILSKTEFSKNLKISLLFPVVTAHHIYQTAESTVRTGLSDKPRADGGPVV
ncbi:hypothetical protein J6590_065219 [Homalodisca vitripennis]|nr:hypothetical protein J6590_065219 [Homalodisca vitripennis]